MFFVQSMEYFGLCSRLTTMADTTVPATSNGKTVLSTEETVANGDVVTTITKTKTVNSDHSVTTTTTVDKTDQTNGDNIVTVLTQTASSSSDPDLEKKIVRQIEYYLGDVNMVRDKFLKNEVTKDEGWIPLSVLTTFKRLQSLTTDFKTIINALKSSVSGLLQIDESENKIRRHPARPVPNSYTELELSLRNRTVYVKGFPKTDDVTIDKLLTFFEKFGAIESVQMKKQFKSKDFNGAAFVVFPSEEKAREFVDKSTTTPIKYVDGSLLECSLQDEHYKKKALESTTSGKTSDDNNKQARKDKRKEELEKKTNEHLEKLNTENLSGALIHLAGMSANATRELIKEKFNPFTKMPWIDFNKGDAEAWVRLNVANTAKDVLEKVLSTGGGKLVIADKEVTSRVVEGEEEAQFWKEANEKRAVERTKKGDRFGGNKRGVRSKRNRRGGQKRKYNQDQGDDDNSNDDDDDEQSAKKSKATTID
jgi:lupus La protein